MIGYYDDISLILILLEENFETIMVWLFEK